MIIELINNCQVENIENLKNILAKRKYKTSHIKTLQAQYLVAIGNEQIDLREIGHMPAVKDVYRVSDEYKLVSRKWKIKPTQIKFADGETISESKLTLIAGPCSIENAEITEQVIKHLKDNNIGFMRAGAFKPRTSPYSFRGLGVDGLKLVKELAAKYSIKINSEVMEVSQIEQMYDYVDIFQVGARNSQNFNLLEQLGKVDKPVLIKRGLAGTLDELLHSAEYVFSSGNEKLILCERGIRTYEKSYRNVLDINAVPYLKEKSHLPVFVDPSHAVGIRKFVEPVALASIIAGADGLLYEIHPNPDLALSDAAQTLSFEQSSQLICKARGLLELREQLS